MAAYLGDAEAQQALEELGLPPLPRQRVALSPEPSQAIRQWILGLGDVCNPDDRVSIARGVLRSLLASIGHDHDDDDLDELLIREKPWSAMRIAAGWGEHVLSETDDEAAIRATITRDLLTWLAGTGSA